MLTAHGHGFKMTVLSVGHSQESSRWIMHLEMRSNPATSTREWCRFLAFS